MKYLSILAFLACVPFAGCALFSPPNTISAEDLQTLQTQAAQGDAKAQIDLGQRYHFGRGVPQDYDKAREWYEKAATQGDATGQNSLGTLYQAGKGVPQDDAKARDLYERAAAQGNALAMYNLGWLYGQGKGVPPDYVKSYMWSDLAAAGAPSRGAQAQAVQSRETIAIRMTPEQIAEAQRLSQQCYAQQFKGC